MAFFDQERKSMLEVFLLETGQLLEQVDAILLDAEKAGRLTPEQINGIFRAVHTTKSSAAMMGLADLSELSHRIEDLFAIFREDAGRLRDVEKDAFDLVFETSDFVRDELKAMPREDYAPQRPAGLLTRIERLMQKVGSVERATVRLRFEKDCKMENIRAFMAARQVRQLCPDACVYPENLEKDPETAEYIRKEGFFISFAAENRDQVLELLRGALFVEECRLVDGFPQQESEPQPDAPSPAGPDSRFISVRLEKLDELQNLTGELLIAATAAGIGGDGRPGLPDGAEHQMDRLLRELEDIVVAMRLVPFGVLVPKLNRIVRDMCKKEKKEIAFSMTGQEVEVDKNIVDNIFEPLMHLLRNAIDHGVEPPEERERLGKKRAGQVGVRFECVGGELRCTVSDDGRGIDTAQVRQTAAQKGLLKRPEESYSEAELLEMCFQPGFSTRESASEYSGRGVGLDVVREMIGRFGGHLSVDSQKNAGTRLTLHLPLSLTIIDSIEFEVGGRAFAVPAYQVSRFFSFDAASPCCREQNGRRFWIDGERCREILPLHAFYGIESRTDEPKHLICVQGASRSACLLVDAISGQRSLVEKPLPKLFGPDFKRRTGIAGNSILGDGTICMMLDTEDLIRAALEEQRE